jgi:general secretion pathway protein D
VRSVRKVPFLGSLPVLGWLFRDTVTTKTKTNLLLFLTPYIIRDESDYRRIYERKRKEQQDFIEQFYGRQPQYEVHTDFARKAGPYSRLRAGVVQEASRLENGGAGEPGQRVVSPFEDAPAAPSRRAPAGPRPPAEDGGPQDDGTPVDRLEVQPELAPPGGEPPEPPAPQEPPPPEPPPEAPPVVPQE